MTPLETIAKQHGITRGLVDSESTCQYAISCRWETDEELAERIMKADVGACSTPGCEGIAIHKSMLFGWLLCRSCLTEAWRDMTRNVPFPLPKWVTG
jgi:hypothetical protein